MERVSLPALYAILNVESDQNPIRFAEQLFIAGVRCLQVRSKNQTEVELRGLLESLLELRERFYRSHPSKILILVNDYVNLSAELSVDGVHLGQGDRSTHETREILGEKKIIGLSTHNVSQVILANTLPIDYLGFGPVFKSITKSGHAPLTGLQNLREAVEKSKLPIVAIGGICLSNASMVFQAGAKSVAVISALEMATDLPVCVQAFVEAREKRGDDFQR